MSEERSDNVERLVRFLLNEDRRMEELKIDIKILTEKRNEKQVEIADLFSCRFPKDEEFRSIKPMVEEILILEAQIDVLKTNLEAIESNKLLGAD